MEIILTREQADSLTAVFLFQCNIAQELGSAIITQERLKRYCEQHDVAPLVYHLLHDLPLFRSFCVLGLPLWGSNYNTLVYAIITENKTLFYLLMELRVDVNVLLASDFRALHFAALYSRFEFMHELLEKGADINAKTKKGKTALSIVLRQKEPCYESILLCCRHGAHITRTICESATGKTHELLSNVRRAQKISRDTNVNIVPSIICKYDVE